MIYIDDHVEKELGISKLTPLMLSTIIKSYNRAQSRNERIRILSILVPDFSYKELRRFNKDSKSVKESMTDEFETDEQGILPLTDEAKWSPDLKYNIYKKGFTYYI